MRAHLMNDTSAWHCGSAAAVVNLVQLLKSAGHEVVASTRTGEVPPSKFDHCDLVVINGEGSMHTNSGHMRQNIECGRVAKEQGKKVYLVNSVWDRCPLEAALVAKTFDLVAVREILSWKAFQAQTGRIPLKLLDVSTNEETPPIVPWEQRAGVAVGHFFRWGKLAHDSAFNLLARVLLRSRFCDVPWYRTLEDVSRYELYVTGEHHGVLAASMMRTPFIALTGNTHKIEGIMEWFGKSLPITNIPASVIELFKAFKYENWPWQEYFDWFEKAPRLNKEILK